MTLCPNRKDMQCCCQPQDGVMCPYGPQPPFEPWKPEGEEVMKLDRNIPENDGAGKYAIINLRKLIEVSGNVDTFQMWTPGVAQALKTLEEVGALEWGRTGEPDEFFLIKLKDRHAAHALLAYANSIQPTDPEFAAEVAELAKRAGVRSPFCKEPD